MIFKVFVKQHIANKKMPVDQKRINGPQNSFSYKYHSRVNIKSQEDRIKELFDENGLRRTHRKNDEKRKIFIKTGVVSQAKGSGYIEMGNTKVLVSVFDPREIPKQNQYCDQGELYCDLKFSPFACVKRKLPQTDAEERSLSLSLKRALLPSVCRHEFPNFQVDVFANVLEDDGSVLAATITAAGLALSDAGVPMYDIITASNVLVLNDKVYLDPTNSEEDVCKAGNNQALNHGILTMARLDVLEQVTELYFSGYIEHELLKESCNKLTDTNKEISQMVKQILAKNVNKKLRSVEKDEKT